MSNFDSFAFAHSSIPKVVFVQFFQNENKDLVLFHHLFCSCKYDIYGPCIILYVCVYIYDYASDFTNESTSKSFILVICLLLSQISNMIKVRCKLYLKVKG